MTAISDVEILASKVVMSLIKFLVISAMFKLYFIDLEGFLLSTIFSLRKFIRNEAIIKLTFIT